MQTGASTVAGLLAASVLMLLVLGLAASAGIAERLFGARSVALLPLGAMLLASSLLALGRRRVTDLLEVWTRDSVEPASLPTTH